jgi:hypothetical protein
MITFEINNIGFFSSYSRQMAGNLLN